MKDGLPVTTIACNGTVCSTGWVKGPVSVSLSAADGGSGVGATRYTLDGTDPTTSSSLYAAPFTLTELTTVKFRSWDSTGANVETVRSQTIKIDKTAPAVQITSPTANQAFKSQDVVVQANVVDTESGIASVDLYLDGNYAGFLRSTGGSSYAVTLPLGTLAPGTHRVKVEGTDKVGNSIKTDAVFFSYSN
jgi:hypothetical protein